MSEKSFSWMNWVPVTFASLLFISQIIVGVYLRARLIKGASTLRVSSNKEKASPRIVFSEGRQDQEIATFKRWRKLIKKAMKTTD